MTEILDVEAQKIVNGGEALCRDTEGRIVFIRRALPGESIRAEITGHRKHIPVGRVAQVLTPSPARIEPPCPMYLQGCGGCQLQHGALHAQQEAKLEMVLDSLKRIAGIEAPSVDFGGAVEPFGYRTTMHLAIQDGRAALHEPASENLLALDTCLIAHPRLGELIENAALPHASNVTFRVSSTTDQRIAWVTGDMKGARLPNDVVVTTDGMAAAISEDVAGRTFKISARSFFQSGTQAAELLAETVDSMVPSDINWVVDAYAGVGLLGSVVASRRNCRVTAVEDSRSAVRDAKANLADLESEILKAEVATLQGDGRSKPDVVIADPARTGLGKSASKALASLGAETFVLVSCDPASFARDVVLLSNHGYSLQKTTVLDLFPQTHHLETVSLFTR